MLIHYIIHFHDSLCGILLPSRDSVLHYSSRNQPLCIEKWALIQKRKLQDKKWKSEAEYKKGNLNIVHILLYITKFAFTSMSALPFCPSRSCPYANLQSCIPNPGRLDKDPDPRSCTTDSRIRILIFFTVAISRFQHKINFPLIILLTTYYSPYVLPIRYVFASLKCSWFYLCDSCRSKYSAGGREWGSARGHRGRRPSAGRSSRPASDRGQ